MISRTKWFGMILGLGVASSLLGDMTLYVAVQGDDAAQGTAAAPLASPQGAVARLRRLRASGAATGAVTVVFAHGRYTLMEPWSLSSADGGTASAPVVWRAAEPGKVVFSGARELGGWRRVTEPAVLAQLPEIARGEVYETRVPGVDAPGDFAAGRNVANDPVQLFEASERLPWARWPDAGYTEVQDVLGEVTRNHDSVFSKSGVIRYASPRLARWARECDLWAHGLWVYAWSDRRVRVRDVNVAAGTLSFDGVEQDAFGIKKGGEFCVFNALCELDRPGEWVLERATRRLFLWPKKVADLTAGAISITRTPSLLQARGLAHTIFSGLVFEGARSDFATFEDCRDVAVQGCVARQGGGWAFRARGGARVRFTGCDVLDVGKGGVALDGGNLKTLEPGGHVVENCHIAHYAVVAPNYNPGVLLRGVGNAVTNALIHHAPHQAIAFDGNDHLIARNVIHDTCSYNDDAGAIYCCGQKMGWNARGTVIAENVIWFTGKRDVPRNTHAVYLDDWSSGITVRDNLIIRCNNGVSLGGGNFVYVTNNIFVSALPSVQVGGRGRGTFGERYCLDGFKSSFFTRLTNARKDPAWRARYPETARLYEVEDGVRAHDPLYNVIAHNVCVMSGGPNPSRYRVDNVITDNVTCAEVGFTDWKGMDWSLRADSPVRQALGHDSCWKKAGLYASAHRASAPVKFGADVTRFDAVPRPAYPPAVPRIDVSIPLDALPTNLTAMAEACTNCSVPFWARGVRVSSERRFGLAQPIWTEYVFSFTPTLDVTAVLSLMGAYGEKTCYDDVRVEGTELRNGGFETEEAWRPGYDTQGRSDVFPPYLFMCLPPPGIVPAEGCRVACVNHERQLTQLIRLKKGRRVTVRFKARAM